MRFLRGLLVGLVTVLPLLLVLGGGTAGPSMVPLTVTSSGLCICHAPIHVALAKGIFEKHGLDVRVLRVASGFEGMAALQTGSAQVADTAWTVLAQGAAQGIQVKAIVMANGDATGKVPTDNYVAIVTRKASGIRQGELQDLKGKKVGLPQGTIAHQYFFYALQAKGLDATKDVIIQHVTAADLPSALQSASVDAIVSWEPTPLQAVELISDAFVVYRGGNHIQFLFPREMSPRYIATNPGTVKKFVLAFVEAAQYTRMHRDETADILAKDFKGVSRTIIRQILDHLPFDLRVSKVTLQAVKQSFEFAVKIGALKQVPTFEELADLRMFYQVQKEHPEFFRDLPPIPDEVKL